MAWISGIAVLIANWAWAGSFLWLLPAVFWVFLSALHIIIRAWAGHSIIEIHERISEAVMWIGSIAVFITSWAWATICLWLFLTAVVLVLLPALHVITWARAGKSIRDKVHKCFSMAMIGIGGIATHIGSWTWAL